MGVRVGLDSLHYAILTKDDSTGVTYQAIQAIPGMISAKISAKGNSATLYADDAPQETASVLGQITVDLETKDLPLSVQAALLGHTITNGVIVRKSTDTAPYVAIGFRSKKSNGHYRYLWLYKGQFTVPDDQFKTQEDKPDFQSQTISGTFVTLANNGAWKAEGDEDEAGFAGGETWFNAVYGVPVDNTAPTVATTPANNATGVADASNFVWTFSEAIDPATVTASNFFVMVQSTGANVAGALSQSGDQKTVTFTPNGGSWTAATVFLAVATTNVADLAGNKLAATSTTKFTST